MIDTSSNKEIKVGLRIDGKKHIFKKELNKQKSEITLKMVGEILEKHGMGFKNLTHIEVNTGPGSFTGLRIGVAIANALSFALKVPVNDKPVGEILEPEYL